MDDKGVYAIARSIWNDPDFEGETFTQREAWMWLIGAATWKAMRVRGSGGPVAITRGEFTFSVRFLAEKFQWSKDKTHRFLKLLEKRDMIRDASRDNSKVYLILKYNEFQVVGLPNKRDSNRDNSCDANATAPRRDRDKEETLETLEEQKEERRAPKVAPVPGKFPSITLPEWLPATAWENYLEMRRKKRAVPTGAAIVLILGKLDRWRLRGHDPTEILNYSTEGNYTGIFEPKGAGNGRKPNSHQNFAIGAAQAAGYTGGDSGDPVEIDVAFLAPRLQSRAS